MYNNNEKLEMANNLERDVEEKYGCSLAEYCQNSVKKVLVNRAYAVNCEYAYEEVPWSSDIVVITISAIPLDGYIATMFYNTKVECSSSDSEIYLVKSLDEMFEEFKNTVMEDGDLEHVRESFSIGFKPVKDSSMLLDNFYVVSNARKHYGASVLLNTDVLDEIHENLGDFIILPSSVHEIMVMSKRHSIYDDDNIDSLRNMVIQVNKETVSDKELLSNNIYCYDGQELKEL